VGNGNQFQKASNKGCVPLMGALGALASLVLVLVLSYLLKDDWKGFQIIDEWWVFLIIGFLFGRLMGEFVSETNVIEEKNEETEENSGFGGSEIYGQIATAAFGLAIPFGMVAVISNSQDPNYILTGFFRYFSLGWIVLGALSYLMWIVAGKPMK
tara:strand:- start:1811 stop:2275 length:465 start_codon:yes stop_codon:yes gene_type:complete